MGFSVTAAHAIFLVASLSAASAGMSAYWKNQDLLEDARRAEAERRDAIMHTSINVTDIECAPLGCGVIAPGSTVSFRVNNNGATTLVVSNFAYLMHGEVLTSAPIIVVRDSLGNVVADTDLLAPQESAAITHTMTLAYTSVLLKVVTEHGVSAAGSA